VSTLISDPFCINKGTLRIAPVLNLANLVAVFTVSLFKVISVSITLSSTKILGVIEIG
jgi:hypothetical protein